MAAAIESVQCFGRKKTAVVVTHYKKGRGLIKINGAPIELVEPEILCYKAFEPVLLLGRQKFAGVDIRIRVRGGGHTSQIYVIRQSIAKALVAYYQKFVDSLERLCCTLRGLSDLGVGLVAAKCKQLQSLDLSYVPITNKCFPAIFQLPYLKSLALVGGQFSSREDRHLLHCKCPLHIFGMLEGSKASTARENEEEDSGSAGLWKR